MRFRGRRGGVVRRVGKLLAQVQVVQDEPVAVVGNAQAVGGLAVGSGGKVGADPGRQPRARVRALRKLRRSACPARRQPSRGSGPGPSRRNCQPGGSCRRRAGRRSAGAGTLPGLPQSRCPSRAAVHVDGGHAFSKEATRSANDGRLDGCDGGAALSA